MMVLTFHTRRATPADAGGIAAAHRDSIQSIGPRFYPAEVVEQWAANLSPDLYVTAMTGGEVFFVAVGVVSNETGILGFATHRVDDNQHGTAVYVRGTAARQGIGTTLFRMAEADAIASGAGSIQIDASLAAVDFYKRHGFEELGRGEHRLRSGTTMACVFMRKVLSVGEHVGA